MPDKQAIADSFSKAASTYDAVAGLQREIGHTLATGVDPEQCHKGAVLDLGCGTGYFTEYLARQHPDAHLAALDLAPGMLEFARTKRKVDAHWVCGDAENLPFATDSFDQIFSSLAIQWCQNITQLFCEIGRVLKSGAQAHIATLGPDTLHELRSAWAEVDHYQHVNSFYPLSRLITANPPELQMQVSREEQRVLHYKDLKSLMRSLKELGAHNMNNGRAKGLTSPASLRRFSQAYEAFRTPQGLPASYQVYYLTLTKTP